MYKRQSIIDVNIYLTPQEKKYILESDLEGYYSSFDVFNLCLLYTSDAADERSSVDLGGRRIIKKKKITKNRETRYTNKK